MKAVVRFDPERTIRFSTYASWQRERSDKLAKKLRTLPPREEDVVRRRFGIGYESEQTPDEIGRELGISGEGVRQIEKKALTRLKDAEEREDLKAFVDMNTQRLSE